MKTAALLTDAHPYQLIFGKIKKKDLNDFENFCEKVSAKMPLLIKPDIDKQKEKII